MRVRKKKCVLQHRAPECYKGAGRPIPHFSTTYYCLLSGKKLRDRSTLWAEVRGVECRIRITLYLHVHEVGEALSSYPRNFPPCVCVQSTQTGHRTTLAPPSAAIDELSRRRHCNRSHDLTPHARRQTSICIGTTYDCASKRITFSVTGTTDAQKDIKQ